MKFLNAKEARALMEGQPFERLQAHHQILLQKHMDVMQKQIYSEIEKEAKRSKCTCHITLSKKKDSLEQQAVTILRNELHGKGYETVLERGFFSSTLFISW